MKLFHLSPADLQVFCGILFIIILLAVLFFIPTEKNKARSRRHRKSAAAAEGKDWKAVSLRLEKHIYGLRKEIEAEQKRGRQLEHDLLIQTEKSKRTHEKLSQERGWQRKEKEDTEKKGRDILRLQQDLKKAEQSLVEEHGHRLKLEREIKENQEALTSAQETRRDLEVQLARLKAEQEQRRQEMAGIRKENAVLKKKHEEATFIAKSDYEKLEKELKEKDRELEDLKRRVQREMT